MNRREQFDSANIVSWKCILQVCDGSVAGVVDAPGPPSARGAAVGKDAVSRVVAEGEGRLGGLERPLARRGADRAADPGRHRGVGPARPQGHLNIIACRHRRPRARPESIAGAQETWVERPPRLGVLFSTIWSIAAYIAWPPHRGRCAGAGKGNRRDLGRRTGSEVYGP